MMKRLRIDMSLRPRAAAREVLSSVVIIVVAKTLLPVQEKETEEARTPPPRKRADYWTRPYFLKVAFQSAASASSVSLAVPSPPIM